MTMSEKERAGSHDCLTSCLEALWCWCGDGVNTPYHEQTSTGVKTELHLGGSSPEVMADRLLWLTVFLALEAGHTNMVRIVQCT